MTVCRRPFLLAAAGLLAAALPAAAQPTYKLDVKPHLKPWATVRLDGTRIVRSEVSDDPGFRLQFHVRQADGKTLATAEARANPAFELPAKSPGVYTAALELFHPAYKGGTAQKGEFRPISNILTFRVEPGGKVVSVPPVLVVECGKGKGASEVVQAAKGYGVKLLQGTAFDGWPATALRPHGWTDAKEVRFEVTLPPGTAGTLRLHFIDGDRKGRKQRLLVQGKPAGDFEAFDGVGRRAEVKLTAADTKAGKVEVTIQSLNPPAGAAVSGIELVPN